MVPSSRTPEGDRIRCHICDSLNYVEPSLPPGDVTCPACGTLIWVATSDNDGQAEILDRTKNAIRTYVAKIQHLALSKAPRTQLTRQIVDSLPYCLAAHGAAVWKCSRRKWWSGRRSVQLECVSGRFNGAKAMAERIANDARHEPVMHEDDQKGVLLIGVPVLVENDTVAVLQVCQRVGSQLATRRGYVRFIVCVAQIAQIAAKSGAFGG